MKERFESFVCNGEEVIVEAAMERADIFFSKLCETIERKTEGRNVLVYIFLGEREREIRFVNFISILFFQFGLLLFCFGPFRPVSSYWAGVAWTPGLVL